MRRLRPKFWRARLKSARLSPLEKRYPKGLLRQRLLRTLTRTFWCDLPQNPCFIWSSSRNFQKILWCCLCDSSRQRLDFGAEATWSSKAQANFKEKGYWREDSLSEGKFAPSFPLLRWCRNRIGTGNLNHRNGFSRNLQRNRSRRNHFSETESTPNMTGRRFHHTMEMIPAPPGSLKALLLPPLLNNVQTRERKGYRRGTARNFLHSFPLSGTPVVQSYWAWSLWGRRKNLGNSGQVGVHENPSFFSEVRLFA